MEPARAAREHDLLETSLSRKQSKKLPHRSHTLTPRRFVAHGMTKTRMQDSTPHNYIVLEAQRPLLRLPATAVVPD